MNFTPDENLIKKCVLGIEGLSDISGIQIRRIEIHDDIPIQTNNTSKVIKMKIEYELNNGYSKIASLVVKVPFLRDEIIYEAGKQFQFFVKEARFYQSIIPRIQKLLDDEIAPTLYVSDEQHVLFLEDLSAQGYRVQVEGPLDKEHSIVVLQQLARLHAASYALDQEDPACMGELIKRQFLFGDEFMFRCQFEVKPLLEALAQHRCLSWDTVRSFDTAAEKARTEVLACIQSSRFDFNVLNHGDLKAHNILFKYDDEQNRPIRCSMIDFQICHWSSPVLDIIFFVTTSMERRIYASDLDTLLDAYLSTLNATLQKLNFANVKVTKAQLRRDMDNVKAFKICSFLFRTLVIKREFCKQFNYAQTNDATPELIDKLAQLAGFQDSVLFWLRELENDGVF